MLEKSRSHVSCSAVSHESTMRINKVSLNRNPHKTRLRVDQRMETM